MKKALWLISGLGVGMGFMYVLDPTAGKRRRSRTRRRVYAAREQMGNVLDAAAQNVRHWTRRAAVRAPSWPVHPQDIYRLLPASQERKARQQGVDKGLLILGGLGLGTVCLAVIGAGSSSRQATTDMAAKTVRDVYDWTCGLMAEVGSWLQKEERSQNAQVTSASTE